ncbi:unnamed protein product [Moneuplotes crassus]|uniref:Uncharacterized protein n=1 Tax=Euplotes crassus TaxID=5936 RepID=A0AAD1ULU3_EUPCR|nr:unnamed protein product [Moneuplotes crassus]
MCCGLRTNPEASDHMSEPSEECIQNDVEATLNISEEEVQQLQVERYENTTIHLKKTSMAKKQDEGKAAPLVSQKTTLSFTQKFKNSHPLTTQISSKSRKSLKTPQNYPQNATFKPKINHTNAKPKYLDYLEGHSKNSQNRVENSSQNPTQESHKRVLRKGKNKHTVSMQELGCRKSSIGIESKAELVSLEEKRNLKKVKALNGKGGDKKRKRMSLFSPKKEEPRKSTDNYIPVVSANLLIPQRMTLDQTNVFTPNKANLNLAESFSPTALVKAPSLPKVTKKGEDPRLSEESTGSVPLVSASLINNKFFVHKEEPADTNIEESYMQEDRESRPSTEAVPIVSSMDEHRAPDLNPFGASK